MAMLAHGLGLPCLRLSTSLSQRLDELPPLTTALPPDAPAPVLEAARRVARCSRFDTLPAIMDLLCARFAYPAEGVSFDSVFMPDLSLVPEAVLCASAFDFPRTGEPPTYLATPVELDREEEVAPALHRFLDADRPLIYVSLGSQSHRFPRAVALFSAVLDAMRQHPEWQAVLAVGRERAIPALADPPPNALLIDRAPQLALLRRAALFLTHAGLGSVREAIALRVPMIAVPQQMDQPGNAARVAHHGLGVHLAPEAVHGAGLAALCEAMLRDADAYRARLAAMHAACTREEEEDRGPAIVEGLVKRARARSRGPRRRSRGPRTRDSQAPSDACGWLFLPPPPGLGPLAAGAVVRSDTETPELGGSGFAICPAIGDALSRAEGSVVACVELGQGLPDGAYIVGRELRCRWIAEAADALWHHAGWCARLALEPEKRTAPEELASFLDLLERHRSLRSSGAAEALEPLWRDCMARTHATSLPAFRIVAHAIHPRAQDAARLARWTCIATLARRAAGAAAGTAAGANRYRGEQRRATARVDRELLLRIVACQPANGQRVSALRS
jgi:UDP:flavonoid glycosyltransferase YjiC (YdhE family)